MSDRTAPGSLLTVRQVAEILSTTPQTVRALIRAGELRGLRVGVKKGYRVLAPDVQAFLSRRVIQPQRVPETRGGMSETQSDLLAFCIDKSTMKGTRMKWAKEAKCRSR